MTQFVLLLTQFSDIFGKYVLYITSVTLNRLNKKIIDFVWGVINDN